MRAVLVLATALVANDARLDQLIVLSVEMDRPTLHVLGVQMLIAGDDDRDAVVTTRVRPAGAAEWRLGPPLFRVWPETVTGFASVPQFSGSIFDLEPNTAYEVEVRAQDPDGVDTVMTLQATTRPIPRSNPVTPRDVEVGSERQLRRAFERAQPGDVITISPGRYDGPFRLNASGTPVNPIVVRGADAEGVVLNGNNCNDCNVLTVLGSFVHVEDLTIINAVQGLRFQTEGTMGNVARRLRILDVVHGIRSTRNQVDFYYCDNTIEGRLEWPWVRLDAWHVFWDYRGIDISGDGHVVCHNRIKGFGDPIVQKWKGARSFDIYGNDIDGGADGVELDGAEGNARFFLNRVRNVYAAVSIQPIYGGPAYVLRNVVHNVFWQPDRPGEQVKLHPGSGDEPSGVLILHNTFLSAGRALNQQTPRTQHNLAFANNLFVGPERPGGGRLIDWTGHLNGAVFDYNGYYPDGSVWLGRLNGERHRAGNFAGLKRLGVFEQNGVLLRSPVFTSYAVGPMNPLLEVTQTDVQLSPGSGAVDAGMPLRGVNDQYRGNGPDLGAWETGCPVPHYGPRPPGQDRVVAKVNC